MRVSIKPIYINIATIAAIVNFVYIIYFFKSNGYLPSPFLNDKSDTFMDFYNPLYWANNYGAYDFWGSVYPPLNFFILNLASIALSISDTGLSAKELREFVNFGNIFVIITYLLLLLFSLKNDYWSAEKKVQLIKFIIIIILSPVVLFSLERGNLIFFALPFIAFYFSASTLIKKTVFLAILVNIKPYFILFLFIDLIKKFSFIYLLLTTLISIFIFILFGLITNDDFYLMPLNLLGFATSSSIFNKFEAITFPSSITSFIYFINASTNNFLLTIIGLFIKIYLYYLIIKLLVLIKKYNFSNNEIAMASVIILSNISMSTGGYSLLFYIPMFPLFLSSDYKKLSVYFLLIFVGGFDTINVFNYFKGFGYSYLTHSDQYMNLGIGLGSFMRPMLNFILLYKFLSLMKIKYDF